MRTTTFIELLRFVLGFIFFWSFLDKLFGLGHPTAVDESWVAGISPTLGFLKSNTQGPFTNIFQSIAGNIFVDWLFMLGLLGVGLALLLGIGLKIASYSGALMMFLIYLSAIPPEHNPIFDEHIVYILVLLLIAEKAGFRWGLRKQWSKNPLVKKYRFLK